MKKTTFGMACFAFAFLLIASTAMAATISITVIPSVGPSTFSPNYNAYRVNAEYAIEHGLTNRGTPGTSDYYQAATGTIPAGSAITTPTFQSWLGFAPPPTGYTGEFGNAIYFGLKVTSPVAFRMNQVQFSSNFFGSPITSDLIGVPFSDHTVGLNGGTRYDQLNLGTGDTQLITTLYTSGIALFFAETNQANLSSDLSELQGLKATSTYTLVIDANSRGTGSGIDLTASDVPEPGAISLLGFSLAAGFVFLRRRG